MKKVLFSLALVVAGSSAFAQINKGQWLVGGNVAFETSKMADADNDTRVTSFQLNPNAGYFFADKFAGGLRLSLETSKVKGEDDAYSQFSLSPFVRYYFLPAAQKVNLFADASYGFGSAGEGDKESFNQFSIMAGPAVFLTPNTALEFGVGYRSLGGDAFGGDKRYNTIGLNIGFQIHLGSAKTSK